MQVLYFVTPAFGRFDLTRACLRQRRNVISDLRLSGIDARCVVIADDENLDIAREFDFEIVEQNNEWLGRKFNDGMEHAGRNGADWIVPIGSDSWVASSYLYPLPPATHARTSSFYCAVTPDKLGELRVGGSGAGPYMFPRSLLEYSRFRPAQDNLRKSIDRSTLRGIGGLINWERRNVFSLQYIGFRGTPTITSYDTLMRHWKFAEYDDPRERLSDAYPPLLVAEAMRALSLRKDDE